jgi:hypothetical protein
VHVMALLPSVAGVATEALPIRKFRHWDAIDVVVDAVARGGGRCTGESLA